MIHSIPINTLLIIPTLLSLILGDTCTCRGLGKIDYWQYSQYQLIIEGKIVEIQNEESNKKINVEILEIYKGSYSKDTVQINTHIDEGGCGISPFLNESWLIFAYRKDNGFKTTLCTRSKRISNTLKEDRTAIEEEIQFLKMAGGPD